MLDCRTHSSPKHPQSPKRTPSTPLQQALKQYEQWINSLKLWSKGLVSSRQVETELDQFENQVIRDPQLGEIEYAQFLFKDIRRHLDVFLKDEVKGELCDKSIHTMQCCIQILLHLIHRMDTKSSTPGHILLDHNGRLKRASIEKHSIISKNFVSRLFEEKFGISVNDETCFFQILDDKSGLYYDFENEVGNGVDQGDILKNGCVVRLVQHGGSVDQMGHVASTPSTSYFNILAQTSCKSGLAPLMSEIQEVKKQLQKLLNSAVTTEVITTNPRFREGSASSIATMVSYNANTNTNLKSEWKKHSDPLSEILRLRCRLNSLKSEYTTFTKEIQSSMSESIKSFKLLQQDASFKQLEHRLQMDSTKTFLARENASFPELISSLNERTEELKNDILHKGCRPDMTLIEIGVLELRKRLGVFKNKLCQGKGDWKKLWEQELNNIVKEQALIKECEGHLDDYEVDIRVITDMFEALQAVDVARKSEPHRVVVITGVKPADCIHQSKDQLLMELQLKNDDTTTANRLQALAKMETRRETKRDELKRYKSPLFADLIAFVVAGRLRPVGGIDIVERGQHDKYMQRIASFKR